MDYLECRPKKKGHHVKVYFKFVCPSFYHLYPAFWGVLLPFQRISKVWQLCVYHKIFECQSYSSNEEIVDLRSQLTSLKELEVNFHLRLLFSDDLSFRKMFFNLVQLICRESKFKDEYLVRFFFYLLKTFKLLSKNYTIMN